MRAKKFLGQHFLKSQKALAHIIDAAGLEKKDLVLEIGPGTGVLTEKLLPLAGKVIAIEKDQELIPNLREKFEKEITQNTLELIAGDILKINPEIFSRDKNHSYKIVANIPYYLTGAILEKFLTATYKPKAMTLLVQREVAERAVAKNGKESLLSLSIKAYGNPRVVARVPRGAFAPAPQVDSAILSITDISGERFRHRNEKLFFELLRRAFGKKRKMVGATLVSHYGESVREALLIADINPKDRPENISISKWSALCQAMGK